MQEKILIVDDEKKMVRVLKAALDNEGYVTFEAYDGEAALDIWRRQQPDLVVLDVMMPRMDGFEFCRRVRQKADTPIIILSARTQEPDKLEGLGLGADDYMTKPFSPRELVARIRALLRRFESRKDSQEQVIARGPLVIDADKHRVEIDGRVVTLTPTEFSLLRALASQPDRVFTRRELIESALGEFFDGYDRTVDAHVGNMRKKMASDAGDWSFIETVYGVGYRFNAEKTV
jgi:two-component system alkaline phosphatase synthesis response regulator PhoP